MPVNLNALIRYKTINSRLYGGLRRYDIDELIDACSDALSESRGRYARISERTVREDIRVMRSDILGFNAPIAQSGGLYFYSDPKYTIMSVGINDPGILQMVIRSLVKIRRDVRHPELETILEKLRALSPEFFEPEFTAETDITFYNKSSDSVVMKSDISPRFSLQAPCSAPMQKRSMINQKTKRVVWADVMKVFDISVER